jgi:hypothetical protein
MLLDIAFASQALLTKTAEDELRRKYAENNARVLFIQKTERPNTMITATTAAGEMFVIGAWEHDIDHNLGEVLSDLGSLLQEQSYNDDYLKPRNEVVGSAWQLLDKAGKQLEGKFPLGTIYPDGNGGLRVEWIRQGAEVRLAIPSSTDERPYIYYQFGDTYDADYNVSPTNLAHWLRQLHVNAFTRT